MSLNLLPREPLGKSAQICVAAVVRDLSDHAEVDSIDAAWRDGITRDYYVRVDAVGYSVDPRVIGRFVDVTASLDEPGWSRASRGMAVIWPAGVSIEW